MKRNKWFKHYNEAHRGQTISELWAENDVELIAFYWSLLEMVSLWESPEERGVWHGRLSIFRAELGMKSQRSSKLLSKIAQRFTYNLEWISDESFKLSIPNWLELQEIRKRRTTDVPSENHSRGERKEERGEKEEGRGEIGAAASPQEGSAPSIIGTGELSQDESLIGTLDGIAKLVASRLSQPLLASLISEFGTEVVASELKNCAKKIKNPGYPDPYVTSWFANLSSDPSIKEKKERNENAKRVASQPSGNKNADKWGY